MNEIIQNLAFNDISAGTIMASALIVCAYKIYHLKPLSNEIPLSDFVSDIYSKELEFFKGLSDQDIDSLTEFYEYNYESRMDFVKINLCKKYIKSQRDTFVNDVTEEVLNQESIDNKNSIPPIAGCYGSEGHTAKSTAAFLSMLKRTEHCLQQ